MSYKRCNGCGLPKETTEFSKLSKAKDGLQPRCKECNAAYFKHNRDRVIAGIRNRKYRLSNEKHDLIWKYLLEHPCVDCGETDPVVLEFDHVRGDKHKGITAYIWDGADVSYLIEEIAKCDIRCANCHRRKTAKELGWYRAVRVDNRKQRAQLKNQASVTQSG